MHPQVRQIIEEAPEVDLSRPLMRRVARIGSRYLVPRAKVPGVKIRNLHFGKARFRMYNPERRSGAALVWIHGGGMVMGAPRQDDRLCAETAARLGILVLSVDYRMAPEHPHPVPHQDALAVWRWLRDNAVALRIDPERIAIGGASAGGGLAAALVHALHDQGGTQPVAQWLIYPMLDDRTAADRRLDDLDHFIWNNTANRLGWSALLRGIAEVGSPDVPPQAAPARREDLSGLPSTWIGVGDIDLFYAEDAAYAQRLEASGVPVQFDVIEGVPHGFQSLAPDAPVVRDLLDRARDWLEAATLVP